MSTGCYILRWRYLLNQVHCCFYSRKCKKNLNVLQLRIKVWYIYTMKYYSNEKKNESMNFAYKWMELGKIILNELTQ